jgi:DNA-binding MarR family transcriptional regulator
MPWSKLGLAPQPAPDNFVVSRINSLNTLLKRRATIYAKRTFNLTQIEWRILTLLGVIQPISILALSYECATDAAQISRGVTRLAAKGYVLRQRSPEDSREARLVLTEKGMKLSAEMRQASHERNDQMIAGLKPADIQAVIATLDALIVRTRLLVAAEEEALAALPVKSKAVRRKSPSDARAAALRYATLEAQAHAAGHAR